MFLCNIGVNSRGLPGLQWNTARRILRSCNCSGAKGSPASQGDRYGHSYFRNAPTVASDVVLTLRDDLDPGTPGRLLESIGPHFWRVPPGYPGVTPQ